MTLRAAKMSLVFCVALYLTVVVFTNLTDYEPNLDLVRHVLMMDSTFVDGHSMWRALNAPAWHVAFYGSIVLWELTAAILCYNIGVGTSCTAGIDNRTGKTTE